MGERSRYMPVTADNLQALVERVSLLSPLISATVSIELHERQNARC